MQLSAAFVPLLAALLAVASPATEVKRDSAVDTATFDDLVWNFQYASSAYASSCAKPNGNTLVTTFSNAATDTIGFIARDDTKKQIVAVFRGSVSATNFLSDSEIELVDFVSPGVSAPAGTLAHFGFLTAYNSVANEVISTVKSQLAAHPGYTIVTSGHSLGGALSSLAGISLQQNFPDTPLLMYTYGQPRTGNPAYANFVNDSVGKSNIFRSTHTTDGVPTIIPIIDGYLHHATEYWQAPDPASAATTTQCNSSGEDPTCSDSIPSAGIDAAHLTYYNILASTPFCS